MCFPYRWTAMSSLYLRSPVGTPNYCFVSWAWERCCHRVDFGRGSLPTEYCLFLWADDKQATICKIPPTPPPVKKRATSTVFSWYLTINFVTTFHVRDLKDVWLGSIVSSPLSPVAPKTTWEDEWQHFYEQSTERARNIVGSKQSSIIPTSPTETSPTTLRYESCCSGTLTRVPAAVFLCCYFQTMRQ